MGESRVGSGLHTQYLGRQSHVRGGGPKISGVAQAQMKNTASRLGPDMTGGHGTCALGQRRRLGQVSKGGICTGMPVWMGSFSLQRIKLLQLFWLGGNLSFLDPPPPPFGVNSAETPGVSVTSI